MGQFSSSTRPGRAILSRAFGPVVEKLEGRRLLTGVTQATLSAALPRTISAKLQGARAELSVAPKAGVSTPVFVELDPDPRLTPLGTLEPFSTAAPGGLSPAKVRHAYGIDQVLFGSVAGDGTGQTIAIVDAYDYPTATSDLHNFDVAFGLPDPPSLIRVNETGGSTLPGVDTTSAAGDTWEVEEALDVQWAHVMAPAANIVLVEATSPSDNDLISAAAGYARTIPGVVAVSMSFGRSEESYDTSLNGLFTTPAGHGGVTFTASTGDNGAPGEFPAYSPDVVAVGGTSLTVDSSGNYTSEVGWSGSGGGISSYESKPAYQSTVTQSATQRTIPDVSLVADPYTGVPVYDSYDFGTTAPWLTVGGTSLSSPAWAGIIAVIDQQRATSLDGPTQTLPGLYNAPSSAFHDVTSGSNGYPATVGYDLVTGRGSPVVPTLVRIFNAAGPRVTASAPTGLQTTAPTSVNFTFSAAMNTSSFDVASDVDAFTGPGGIDLLPTVTGFSWSTDQTALTVTFTAPTQAGPFAMTIGPNIQSTTGAAMDQNTDGVAGTSPADRYTASFNYTSKPLVVASISPTAAGIVAGPTVTFSATFNAAVDPSSVSTANLTPSKGTVSAVSVSADRTVVQYTVSGLTDGPLTLSLAAAALKDADQNPLSAAFSAAYTVDNPISPYPTPFTAAGPPGALVYSGPVVADTFLSATDVDTYTLPLSAGQQLTVVSTGAKSLQLDGPDGAVLATASNANAGSAVLQSVNIATAGTYSIVLSGPAGPYTLAATSNAAVELQNYGGPAANSTATAQNLDGAFTSLGGAGGRAAVGGANLPVVGATTVFTDDFESGLGGFTIDNTTASGLWHVSVGRGNQSGHTATHSLYFGQGETINGGGTYNTGGRTAGYATTSSITLPSGSPKLTFNYVLKTEGSTSYDLAQVQVSTDGGTTYTTLKSYNGVAETTAWTASTVDLSAYAAKPVKLRLRFDTVDGVSNGYEGWYVDDFTVGTSTGTGVLSPAYYGVTLVAGESASFALQSLAGGASDLKLYGPTGSLLTQNPAPAGSVSELITDFVAPATGIYYAQVNGPSGSTYTLAVTKDADLGVAGGAGTAAAQPIRAGQVVGHVAAGVTDTYAVAVAAGATLQLSTTTPGDGTGQPGNAFNPMLRLLNSSGTVIASDDNSAPDGKNASLTYTASAAGTYYVQVLSTTASSTAGDYVLAVNGVSGAYPPFTVGLTTPASGSSLTTAPTTISVVLNSLLYLPSVSAASMTLDGVSLGSASVGGGNTVSFTLPSNLSAGTHTFALAGGSLTSLQNVGLTPFSGQFTVVGVTAAPTSVSLSNASDTGVSSQDGLTNLNNSAGRTLSFLVNGTIPGATVTLYINFVAVGTAVASATTTTIVTNGTSPVADGYWAVVATQTAPGQATSPYSGADVLNIKTVTPSTPAPLYLSTACDSGPSNTDGITNIVVPVFGLSVSTPYYRIYRDGVLVSAPYATGVFTSAALSDGTYGFQLAAVDNAGNQSALSPAKVVVIDTVAPATPTVNLQTASDTGFSSGDRITSNTSPTFDVTSSEPGSVVVSVDGAFGGTGPAPAAGTVSVHAAGTGIRTFSPASNYSVGGAPAAVAVGDLNNDGFADVLISSASPAGVNVLLADGAGGLALHGLIPLANAPAGIVTGDFNNDGKLDFAVAYRIYALSIYLGDGQGGFTLSSTLNAALDPFAIAAADMNNDGITDLELTGASDQTVSFYAGQGDGTFKNGYFSTESSPPNAIALADLNADGTRDVVTADPNNNIVHVFVNNGTGRSGYSGGYFNLNAPSGVAAGDFNGDGKIDVVASSGTDGYIYLAKGTGDGYAGLTAPTKFAAGGSKMTALVAGDFNGDGKLDVAVTITTGTTTAGSVAVLYGDGLGSFGAPTLFTVGVNPTRIAVADVNGDGLPDLVVTNAGSNTVSVIRGNNGNPFTEGVHNVTAIAQDLAGNNSAAGSTVVTIDTRAPATPPAPLLESASDSGVSPTDRVTNVNQPTIELTGGPYYRVYRDGVLVSGNYGSGSAFTSPTLADGTYTFTYAAVDAAGNASPVGPGTTVTIDTTPPTAAFAAVEPPASTATLTFSEAVSGLSPASFTLTRDGGPDLLDGTATITSTDGVTWTIGNLPATTAGDYTLTLLSADISDVAGNPLEAAATVSWTVASTGVVLNGSAGNLYLRLDAAGDTLDVWQATDPSTTPTSTYPRSDLNGLTILGGSNTIDDTDGPIAAQVVGGSLTVLLPSAAAVSVGSSTISIGAATIGYDQLSAISVVGSAGGDTFIQVNQPSAATSFTGDSGTDRLDIRGGTFALSAPMTLADLTVTAAASVDVATHALSLTAGDLSAVTAEALDSRLTSSAIDSSHLTTLAVVPSGGGVRVAVAYFGDLNLDGVVDGSDYSLIDSGYLTGATGWANGDVNFDGVVDGSDYTLVDNAYNRQTSPIVPASKAATTAAAPADPWLDERRKKKDPVMTAAVHLDV